MKDDMAAAGVPESGMADGAIHRFPIRVYYENTDSSDIVYHAEYLRFFERARTEALRLAGFAHPHLAEAHGVAFAVTRIEVDFKRPARLDDALEIVTRVIDLRAASLTMGQRATRRDSETGAVTDLVRMIIRLACIDGSGRPARFPAPVRASLGALITKDGTGGRITCAAQPQRQD